MNHCSVKLTMPMLTWSLDAEGFHFNGLEMRYVDGVLQIGDTASSYINWFFDCFSDGKLITPEEHFREFRAVTKERIVQAANSLKLDTVYLMLDKEVQE